MLESVIGPVADLARLIAKWIKEGMSREEIQKRLADPTGVAADMLDRAVARRKRGRGLLGRDPKLPKK